MLMLVLLCPTKHMALNQSFRHVFHSANHVNGLSGEGLVASVLMKSNRGLYLERECPVNIGDDFDFSTQVVQVHLPGP